MNPNFALDFRNDQIKLLHLQEGHWVQIGVVAIDDPDLDAALGYMRSTALGLSPRGVASKLVLPDEAVLYTTVGDLSYDPQARAAQIARALIGRTPYKVADLVYDWNDDGSNAHMAVIARETLDEAEAFAVQHRFNPVAFAAWPEKGQFQGEADFGKSETALDVSAPSNTPIDHAAALSAKDFEMGDTEVSEETQATPVDAIKTATADQSVIAEIAPNLYIPVTTDDLNDRDQGQMADPVISDLQAALDPISEIETVAQVLGSGQDTADLDTASVTEPDPALLSDTPNIAAEPQPLVAQTDLLAPFSQPVLADEAPMALDVPIDEPVDEDPAPTTGPSAGKAQTLLAEFAARREVALGKPDAVARVEPLLSTGNHIAPPKIARNLQPDVSTEASAKPVVLAAQKPNRKAETSLGNKPVGKRPKERGKNSALIGFVLTILLLIALAAAAAMSSYLTAAWNSYSAATNVALIQPSIADEMAVDLPSDDIMSPVNPAPQTAEVLAPLPPPDPITLPAPSVMLTAERANDLVPLTTPAALAQPLVIAPPDIVTASSESAAPSIIPTAQGVMTPDGVFLISGKPRIVPNPRPAAIVAAALQRPAITPLVGATATYADPALAGKRPERRPDALAPQIASDPALAGKLPLARPDAILQAGLEADNAALIASATLATVNAPRSPLAVTISRLPVPRPSNLNTTIAAPQDLVVTDPVAPEVAAPEVTAPEVSASDNAAAPLEADNEPEVVAAKSSGPRTVVSKNATYKNAINLSKINLIGVYGSQANRYALVRQSNGRFKKVYVGDRFDGGLVAAITENELRYSKSGRMLALQMPKG